MVKCKSWGERWRTALAGKGAESRQTEAVGRSWCEKEETGKEGLGLQALEPPVPI